VEIIDYSKVVTKDADMKPADSDDMYFGLIDTLNNLSLHRKMADTALSKCIDKHSIRYLFTAAKVRMHQERFSEAAACLDELISKQKDHLEAWVLRGHAYYFNDNLFDSEESYIKALRLNPHLDDKILQERLGIVYIKRKAWKDARTVFLKCCKETTRFVSWAYLGYCLLKLGELA
jgi:tetratricopeptide (TPR) repeat protein